ncbi:MAG: hypothetical protein JKY54_06880 [Flavobacteriales bacterium]|nr:hypothetical protein [Flavobacteriales bacterium]
MKHFTLSLFLIFIGHVVLSQFSFKTGSAELDLNLNSINKEGKADLPKFKTDLKLSYNVSSKKLDQMFSLKMQPGEIYFALEIANLTKKPIDDVIKSYQANKDKGWGVIAKELGIKPGSPEFHALKNKSKEKKAKGKSNAGGKGNSKGKGNGNSKGKKK